MKQRFLNDTERLEIDARGKYEVLVNTIQQFDCLQSIVALKRFIKNMHEQKKSFFVFRGQQMGFHVFPFLIDLVLKHSTSTNSPVKLDEETIMWLIERYVKLPEIITLPSGAKEMDKYAPEWYIRTAFEQLTYQEMTRTLVPRILYLYEKIPNANSDKFFKFINVRNEVLRRQFRVTLDDLLLCTLALAEIANANDRFQDYLDCKIDWLKKYLESPAMPIVRSQFTLSLDEYAWKAKRQFSGKYSYIRTEPKLILDFPIVKINDYYIAPEPRLLVTRVTKHLHDSFYQYFIDNGKLQDYSSTFGDVFKDYVGLLLKECFETENVFDLDVLIKGNTKRADWMVIRDNTAVLFECKACRYSKELKKTGSLKLMRDFISKNIAPALTQLDESEQQLKKMGRVLPKLSEIRRTHRILIFEEDFYFSNALSDFIANDSILLKLEKENVQIISMLELETLLLSNYSNDLVSVFTSKVDGPNRKLSFDFHLRQLPNFKTSKNNILDQTFEKYTRRK